MVIPVLAPPLIVPLFMTRVVGSGAVGLEITTGPEVWPDPMENVCPPALAELIETHIAKTRLAVAATARVMACALSPASSFYCDVFDWLRQGTASQIENHI
jgi:hypothetical protein